MATGLPAGQKLEVEFTAGVWTDLSADVDFAQGIPITRGRISATSLPTTGSMVFQLTNAADCQTGAGSYTPLRQVLADGTTAHPYYPNVVPRKQVRYSNTLAGVRFRGFVNGWAPSFENGVRPVVIVQAYDRLKYLAGVELKSPIVQETSTDPRLAQWGLTEPAGSTSSIDLSGNKQAPLTIVQSGTGGPLVFGDSGPGPETGVKFAPVSVSNGQYLTAGCPTQTLNALEAWVQIPSAPASTVYFLSIDGGSDPLGAALTTVSLGVNSSGQVVAQVGGVTLTGTSINDLGWHHVMFTRTHPSTVDVYGLYLDGVLATSVSGGSFTNFSSQTVNVGQTALSVRASALFTGNIGYPALYTTVPAFARIGAHYQAGRGYTGETTGVRIPRHLGAAGMTSSDWTVDTGKAIVGTYPQKGKSVLQACQDMQISEGGGAAFYVTPDGNVRFADRAYRKPAAPVLTLDAQLDLINGPYLPGYDDENLVNACTATRSAQSGTLTTQTYSTSATLVTTGDVTTYAITDADALNLAQSIVAGQATPGFRLPQVAVDLMTAANSLYAALANVQIGSRIRVTNLPAGFVPSTQMDFIVEGWTETPALDSYIVVFDTSPADNPARAIWDDTSYGRWGCSGQTLNGTVTNSATTIVLATTAGLPTFTTVGARYPLKIQIGQEVLTLTAAPGGAVSPQTFTGVTRGVDGTTAAAQTAGAAINLWPTATYTL